MARPNRLQEIEQEKGKPIQEVIIDALNREGTMPAAAAALGVTFGTLFGWCKDLGIQKRVIWELPHNEKVIDHATP